MVLMPRCLRCGRDLVDIDVEESFAEAFEVIEADLFEHLTTRRAFGSGIGRLEVPARLKPQAELSVKDEQQLGSVRTEHERAGREVTRRIVMTSERVVSLREKVSHPREVTCLERIDGEVRIEESGKGAGARRRRHGGQLAARAAASL